jgi:hypothetical protein
MSDHVSSALYIQEELNTRLEKLASHLKGDAVTVIGPMHEPMDSLLRRVLEDIKPRGKKLVILLETSGGYIEVTERMVTAMRHFYQEVDFIIPSHALSAGTVLVMSGDAIYMDYFSVLGPIDPQIPSREGRSVPALGYLAKFEEMIARSGQGAGLTAAEIAYLVERFDPGELHAFEQAKKLSIDLLKTWLVKYKFKDWKVTATQKITVTSDMREARAESVAELLNNIGRWKSHGRGITKDVLINDAKLMIENFGKDSTLDSLIKSYYRLLKDHMAQQGQFVVLHSRNGYNGI